VRLYFFCNILSTFSAFVQRILNRLRYDGSRRFTGYPHGLKGEDIPIGARILAAADAVDAMLSRRTGRMGGA